MHRFFLPPDALAAPEIVFPAETARQIRAVLRLHAGARVIALDDLGSEYEIQLAQVDASAVRGLLVEKRSAQGEPRARLSLYLGLTQREKFEWVLQKCTELGAAAFTPFVSSRALVQDTRDAEKKSERWQRIIQEAAEQSGRGRIPVLRAPLRFPQALADAVASHDAAMIAWEGETGRGIGAALTAGARPQRVAVLIGPEGGFSVEEVEQAQAAGLLPVTLGARILRMETAAIAAITLTLYALGEMG